MARKEDVRIEKVPTDEVEVYDDKINLDDDKKKIVTDDIFREFDVLKEERDDIGFDNYCDEMDAIYGGDVPEIKGQQFSTQTGILTEKCDNGRNRVMEAFTEGDKIFSITPRPDFAEESGYEITDKQEEFLDYKFDEVVNIKGPLSRVIHSGFLRKIGWLFVTNRVIKQRMRERKTYKGDPKWFIKAEQGIMPLEKGLKIDIVELLVKLKKEKGDDFEPDFKEGMAFPTVVNGVEAVVIYKNEALAQFVSDHMDAFDRYKGYMKEIHDGKESTFVSYFTEYVYDDPMFESIHPKNVYVRIGISSLMELAQTHLIVHRKEYNWHQLKKLEEDDGFFDVDKLLYPSGDMKKTKKKGAENKMYDVLRCTYFYDLGEGEEEKCIFYFDEKTKTMIGSHKFKHDRLQTEYIPFIPDDVDNGLYSHLGMGDKLIDDNITADAFQNFLLQTLYLSSMITPLCEKGSTTDEQMMNEEFVNGMPMYWGKDTKPDFLQRYMPKPDVAGIMAMLGNIKQNAGEKVHINPGMSGKESPSDPRAPASKTIALMNADNFNFNAYIKSFGPSFNQIGYSMLAIYHQKAKDGKLRYRPKKKGDDVKKALFSEITRDELIARTNVQTQAYLFAVDKLRAKQENVALYSLVRPELKTPEEVNNLLRVLVKDWSPFWKNNVDKILPDVEEVERRQMMAAMQVIDGWVKEQLATGDKDPDIQELYGRMLQANQAMAATPEQREQMEKEQK